MLTMLTMLTKQQRLIESVINEVNTLMDNNPDNTRFVLLMSVMRNRLDELEDCPQNRVPLIQSHMIMKQVLKRHGASIDLTGLEILFAALDDDYKAEFEEELLAKMSGLTDIELKWIAQYSRNDKQIAELASELLDWRSGV